jgi:hypothetical protein
VVTIVMARPEVTQSSATDSWARTISEVSVS